MNERIKELAARAGFGPTNDPHVRQSFDVNLFAELIVKECMEQVWYTRDDGINGNISQVIKDRIKEHFGVE